MGRVCVCARDSSNASRHRFRLRAVGGGRPEAKLCRPCLVAPGLALHLVCLETRHRRFSRFFVFAPGASTVLARMWERGRVFGCPFILVLTPGRFASSSHLMFSFSFLRLFFYSVNQALMYAAVLPARCLFFFCAAVSSCCSRALSVCPHLRISNPPAVLTT